MNNYIHKILYILGDQKNKLAILLLSFIFISSLEAFSIGLIGPFISIATKPEQIYQNNILNFFYQKLGFVGSSSEESFIAILGVFLTLVFCLKSYLVWRVKVNVYSFSSRQQVLLRKKLMHSYLDAPYAFHLGKNSAHIINNILSESFQFCYAVLNPLLELIANLCIVIFISILLSITSWIAIISIVIVFLPVFLLLNRFKLLIAKWGRESSESNQAIVRAINHGLGGIKETKLMGCGAYFENKLTAEAMRYSEAQKNYYAFNLTPRIIVEAILIIFLIGFTSVSLLAGQDINNLTSLLSVFAIASMRFIPAATQIANASSSLKNSSFTVNKLYSDLKELAESQTYDFSNYQLIKNEEIYQHDSPRSFQQSIELESVRYSYAQSKIPSLANLSLKISKGSSIALIGKSGAGKTTLVDVMLGLLIPQSGDIKVDGISIYKDLRAWQNMIGYIPQSIFLIEDTIEKNIAFGMPEHLIDKEKVWKAINAAQLSDFVNDLPKGINSLVGERGANLSGGQRQRIGIARALYYEREILVLDEATAALDNETEQFITESIKALSKDKTIITIAHRLTTIKHCDCIYLMENGKIIQSGSYDEVVLKKTVA